MSSSQYSNRGKTRACAAFLALIAALFAAGAVQAKTKTELLPLSPCELNLPGTGLTAPAECGWFEVAENPAEPNGRKIKLRVARVPAQERRVAPDPLVLFAGGPGQAATEAWLIMAPALRKMTKNRDVLLIDQRGTGQSNPLRCPQIELEEALALDWEHVGESTQACLDSLQGDPRFYTTTIAMQDYDLVRAALGYEKLNLLGVSYGTRAAQVYLRLFPDRVRTMVLDSVVPQTLALGSEHAEKLDQAVEKVLSACAADAKCEQAFPDVAGALQKMIVQLDGTPLDVTVDHPLTGQPFTFSFNREALGSAIRFLTYSAETQAMLPLLIHEAAITGNYGRIASQLLITASGLSESIAQGMEMSVVCAEDFPLFPEPAPTTASGTAGATTDTTTGTTAAEQFLLGDTMLKASRIQCGIWPRGDVPDGFHDAVVSDVPTLLLSGAVDPVTPPEYAEQVKEYLSNSLHLVAPGQGHGVTVKGCIGQLVSDFVMSGKLDELDATCINQLQASPWFMTLTGPNP